MELTMLTDARRNAGGEIDKGREKPAIGKASAPRRLRLRAQWLAVFCGLALLNVHVAAADQATGQAPAVVPLPKVISVTGQLKLGEDFTVEVDCLTDWAARNDVRKLVPYLNGRELAGVYPDAIHLSHNQVLFHLERTPDSKEAWADLLRNPVLRR